MAVLKFTTMDNGAQCAMITGISMMPMWCVASLDSLLQLTSTAVPDMGKARGEFGWMILGAGVGRHRYLLALTWAGGITTVVTAKMQVSSASPAKQEYDVSEFP